MEMNELEGLLEDSDLRSVLIALGRDCLANRVEYANDCYVKHAVQYSESVNLVATASLDLWSAEGLRTSTGPGRVLDALLPMRNLPGALIVACLQGICAGAASVYFTATARVESFPAGMPVPIPVRKIEQYPTTPHPATASTGLLDPESGFSIWDGSWVLELDYRFRDRLDHVCWPVDELSPSRHRLARIATVHPFLQGDFPEPAEVAEGRFFGVAPARGDDDPDARVRNQLSLVAGHAEIAIAPELCLSVPEAVETAWVSGLEMPPLVVPGSAHVERDGVRSNEAYVYLDGLNVLQARKRTPFVYRVRVATDGPAGATRSLREDLTPVPPRLRLLASSTTRLAVAICADLNDPELSEACRAAWVNILLAPAYSPKAGRFPGVTAFLAAFTQCVSVVVNVPGNADAPFWALTAVPGDSESPQMWNPPEVECFAGLLDPNVQALSSDRWKWLDLRVPRHAALASPAE